MSILVRALARERSSKVSAPGFLQSFEIFHSVLRHVRDYTRETKLERGFKNKKLISMLWWFSLTGENLWKERPEYMFIYIFTYVYIYIYIYSCICRASCTWHKSLQKAERLHYKEKRKRKRLHNILSSLSSCICRARCTWLKTASACSSTRL